MSTMSFISYNNRRFLRFGRYAFGYADLTVRNDVYIITIWK